MTAEAARDEAIRVERLTVRFGDIVACGNVSFSVPTGAVYALLGRSGSGKTTVVRCLLGKQDSDTGRVLVLGEDARKKRRRLASRIATSILEFRDRRELLILDDPGEIPEWSGDASRTTLIATEDPTRIAGAATHFGILKRGRLVIDTQIAALEGGIRRLRYANRPTETRTAFGTELDEFNALSVRVRGWGVEAIVSNFDNAAFARFREIDGVEDAVAESLTLEEAFQALG